MNLKFNSTKKNFFLKEYINAKIKAVTGWTFINKKGKAAMMKKVKALPEIVVLFIIQKNVKKLNFLKNYSLNILMILQSNQRLLVKIKKINLIINLK